jgi:hypothetical protein
MRTLMCYEVRLHKEDSFTLRPLYCLPMATQISKSSSSRRRQAVGPVRLFVPGGAYSRTEALSPHLTSPYLTSQVARTFTQPPPTSAASACLKRLLLCFSVPSTYKLTHSCYDATRLPTPSIQPVIATNATHLHAPAAVPGRVVPGPPPAAASSCRPTRTASSTDTGTGAGAGTSSRCCSRGGPTTTLQPHCWQQWHCIAWG